METLFNLQKINVTVKEAEDAKPLLLTRGEIKFENVTFGYREDRYILRDLNMTIPGGRKVAIVGPSGCGKSTVLRLLFRYYDVQSGRILIDGQDVRHVSLESLRKAIGVVPQDTPLFNASIEHNIRYGRLDASDAEVRAAARRAKIDEIVESWPEQYKTMVGERGMMISGMYFLLHDVVAWLNVQAGGEKQRLAIARCVLKDPPLLFFDEATSALDTHTEQALLQNINSILKDKRRTSVSVAHRLRTIYDSDLIIVLREGQVAESGTHEQLVSRGGLYSELWSGRFVSRQIDQIADFCHVAQETLFVDDGEEGLSGESSR